MHLVKLDYFMTSEKFSLLYYALWFILYPEKRLADAEIEVNRANLNDRLAELDRIKNEQNQSIKSYQNEMIHLESEVKNIKLISEALPDRCFKQPRLEPV